MNKTCQECGGKCCQTLMLRMPAAADTDLMRTRGSVYLSHVPDQVLWVLPIPCRHFAAGKCTIYENRPEACRNYVVDGFDCTLTRSLP